MICISSMQISFVILWDIGVSDIQRLEHIYLYTNKHKCVIILFTDLIFIKYRIDE